MSGVLSLRLLRSLPDGFRERFNGRALTSSDVQALRRIGYRPNQFGSIRSERRPASERNRRSSVSLVVPASRAEAQLMNYLKKQDYIESYNSWPDQMRRLAIRVVKDDRSRFLMAVYYALHGLSPDLSRDFILASGVRNGELVRGPYNDHQLAHLERVFAMLEKPGFLDRYEKLVPSQIRQQIF
ncbi:hypothetical protein [Crucivirus-419]|nr:hypothetical protein [Crucivirus-419]